MKGFRIFGAMVILALLVGPDLVLSAPASAPSSSPVPDAVDADTFPEAFSGGPSYDSGWLDIGPGATLTLTHNLGGITPNLLVDLQARTFSSPAGVNNRFTGGIEFGASPYAGSAGDRMGVFWHNLSISIIKVTRQAEDTLVSQVRIRIWKTPGWDYSSTWFSISPGTMVPLTLYTTCCASEYVVDLMFYDANDGLGVNQRANGGRDLGPRSGRNNARVGAVWYGLTDYTLNVYRYPEDFLADQVLVRIWHRPRPTYDSGWVDLAPGATMQLSHNIKGAPDDMLVDMQFRSFAVPDYGVNNAFWGGNDFGANAPAGSAENDRVGAYWYGLTNNALTVVRREEDVFATQVRVRIFHFWTPTRPGFDGGWRELSKNSTLNLIHGIRQPHNAMVDLQFKSTTVPDYGINNRAYGGMDGNGSFEHYGAYWYGFTIPGVSVYRRDDDVVADQVRLRIWDMPKAAYDSNFTGIAAGQTLTFYHNLNGNPADYLVDLQFLKMGDPVYDDYHQIAYGIMDLGPGANENMRVGAAWHNLTDNSIQVTRGGEDTYLNSVRVRIWLVSRPDFNTTWMEMALGTPQPVSHFLGHTTEDYFVNVMFLGASAQINHLYYGTNWLGAYGGQSENAYVGGEWRDLTNNSITLYRAFNDDNIYSMQARIWVIPQKIFVPVIKR